jgi:hypothetical protein
LCACCVCARARARARTNQPAAIYLAPRPHSPRPAQLRRAQELHSGPLRSLGLRADALASHPLASGSGPLAATGAALRPGLERLRAALQHAHDWGINAKVSGGASHKRALVARHGAAPRPPAVRVLLRQEPARCSQPPAGAPLWRAPRPAGLTRAAPTRPRQAWLRPLEGLAAAAAELYAETLLALARLLTNEPKGRQQARPRAGARPL